MTFAQIIVILNSKNFINIQSCIIWLNGVLTQQYLLYTMEITIKGEIRRIQVPFFVEFIYDESNQAQGCILNGDAGYLFVRNLQGDIIALADMEGRVMIEYNYDPWGKISYTYFDENGNPSNEIADESLQMITAIFCPLTYRGYNYDFTTGLYYLQSRYYNPEWGRFLNCDDTSILLATQGETHGANLFAYCNNDPVNNADTTGRLLERLTEDFLNSYINLIGIIANDHYMGRGSKNNFLNWKPVKGTRLYNLQVRFYNENFPEIYDTVKQCFLKSADLTCGIIAFFAGIYFRQSVGRQFLFSPDCMAREIKYHVASYMANFKRSNSNPVDISEADVYQDKIFNKIFDYNSGIRDCYRWTSADPFLVAYSIPGATYKYRLTESYIDSNNTAWEGWLMYYGK